MTYRFILFTRNINIYLRKSNLQYIVISDGQEQYYHFSENDLQKFHSDELIVACDRGFRLQHKSGISDISLQN